MKQHKEDRAERASPARIFSRSTDGAIWVGPKQESALDHLRGRSQVKVLVGPQSSGKSSILRLFEQRVEDAVVLSLVGPQKSALGVLTALIASAKLSVWELSEIEQRNLLTVFMEHRGCQGKRIVICVDNVSEISSEAWDEIDRLTRLRVDARPFIELVVAASTREAGSAPLARFLRTGSTSAIESIHFLHAPSEQDLASYIAWRLARFGVKCVFSPDVCAEIARWSRGRFDSVNVICQVLLWNRSLEQLERIDKDAVSMAVSKLAELKMSRAESSLQKPKPIRTNGARNGIDEAGRLTILHNGETCAEFPLAGSIRIGRGRRNHIRLNSRLISRHHATIARDPSGRYFVFDCDSKNGTLVNGTSVDSRALDDGDVINLCEYLIRVELFDTTVTAQSSKSSAELDLEDTAVMPALDPSAERVRIARSQRR